MTGRNLVQEIRECKTWNVISVNPEHLCDKAWREITADYVYRANIVYGCVDEAHLINEWGANFRRRGAPAHPRSSPIPSPPKRPRRALEEVTNDERPARRPTKKAAKAALQSAARVTQSYPYRTSRRRAVQG
jgi:hypothetical protein